MKKVKLINDGFNLEITERTTEYNSRKVWSIDTSVLRRDKLIILNDINNKKISEIIIPQNMVVIVEYMDC